MAYRIESNGFTIHADTVEGILALVGHPTAPGADLPAPQKEKAPRKRAAKKSEAPATKPGPLVCRKPHGCGKAFESENRMAWYCPSCAAKRDEGRPA